MLTVSDLHADYGETRVLRGIDLTIPAGCIVAMLGPNGAGKTTLLRSVSGLLTPRRGTVRVDGVEVTDWSHYKLARAGVCHVPEGRGVFRSLSVRENLLMQAPQGEEMLAIERAAEVFPILGERLRQEAGTLSGGEQQMLAMARAYVSRPRVVLLDEPSMGLAPKVVDDIFEFLPLLVAEGAGVLLVEQYVVRALEIAEYVYVLNRGVIDFAGEPGELDANEVFRSYVGSDL